VDFVNEIRSRTTKYLANRVASGDGLTSSRSEDILDAFSKDGLTKEILNAQPVDRSFYLIGLNVRLRGCTMEQFVEALFEYPHVELATAVLGTHDCFLGIYCSQKELTNWLWGDMRELEKMGLTIVNTTTFSPYSKVKLKFDPREHPRYLDVSLRRFRHQAQKRELDSEE